MERNNLCPRSIRYLLAVAEHHSFTRAAEALYVSQPTLSQQIKQLEETLDVQLLDRSGRQVRLTDAGEVYSDYARRALSELAAGKRAIHELQDLSRGSLQIGMTPITEYLAAPLLDRFSKQFPGISVDTTEMPQDDIEAAVAEDRLDIGIAFTNTLASESHADDIEMRVLFIESLHLALGNEHAIVNEDPPIDAHCLEDLPLALLNSDFALRRHVDLYCLEHDIAPNIVMESNSLSIIVELVQLGRLATILPNAIACAQRGIHPVMLLPELPHHNITLICRTGAYRCPACTAFVEMAEDWSGIKTDNPDTDSAEATSAQTVSD